MTKHAYIGEKFLESTSSFTQGDGAPKT